jgi:hypothetical protein
MCDLVRDDKSSLSTLHTITAVSVAGPWRCISASGDNFQMVPTGAHDTVKATLKPYRTEFAWPPRCYRHESIVVGL